MTERLSNESVATALDISTRFSQGDPDDFPHFVYAALAQEVTDRRAADAQMAQGEEAAWKALRLSDFADPIVLITEGVIDALRIAHRHGYHARDAELTALRAVVEAARGYRDVLTAHAINPYTDERGPGWLDGREAVDHAWDALTAALKGVEE